MSAIRPGDRAVIIRAAYAENLGKVVHVVDYINVPGSCKRHKFQNVVVDSLGSPFKTDSGPQPRAWICKCGLRRLPPMEEFKVKQTNVQKKKPQTAW